MGENTGTCSNCGDALCGPSGPSIAIHCTKHKVSNVPHHADREGALANEHCTRAKKVVVKGCFDCPAVGRAMECRLDDQFRDITPYWHNGAYEEGGELRPGWCRLLTKPAGVLLVAKVPAKEEG